MKIQNKQSKCLMNKRGSTVKFNGGLGVLCLLLGFISIKLANVSHLSISFNWVKSSSKAKRDKLESKSKKSQS